MFQRLSFIFAALLLLISSQAFAGDDDFVFSRESNFHTVISNDGQPEGQPEADTQSYGGNRPSDTPDIGGAQQASTVPQKKEHPKPELPAGWTAPQDAPVGNSAAYLNGNSYSPFTTGMFSGNGSPNIVNGNGELSQIQQLLQNAQAPTAAGNAGISAPRAAGNLAMLPSGFTSPSQMTIGGSYARGGLPTLPVAGIVNSPLGLAAALSEGDEDGGATSPQDRAMIAAYLNSLLQYVASQPNNPVIGGAGGLQSVNYGYGNGVSYAGTSATKQLARGAATTGSGMAGGGCAGVAHTAGMLAVSCR